MARRKGTRTRTRYRTKVRRIYSKGKNFLPGGMSNAIWSGAAGVAGNYIPSNLPVVGKWAKPVIFGAGGFLLKKPALMSIAFYEAGKMFSSGFGSGSNGGFYE